MNWLKWLSIILLGFAGLIGLGMSLCGGVFLISALGKPFSSGYGVGWIALIVLAIGVPVLVVSVRQLQAVLQDQQGFNAADYPVQIKRIAVLAGVDFVLSGYWFFLPVIVSLLRRRKWSRWVIAVLVASKWLYLVSVLINPYGYGMLLGFSFAYLVMDVILLTMLFSQPVSAWLDSEVSDQ